MLAGESHTKSIFTTEAETTADRLNGACPGDNFFIENIGSLPEFVTYDETTGLITVDAPSDLVDICHGYDIGIWHAKTIGESEMVWVTLFIEPNCAVQEFVPLVGFPESIHYRAIETFDASEMLSLVPDSEGNSWDDLCGVAELSIEAQLEGVSVEQDTITVQDM